MKHLLFSSVRQEVFRQFFTPALPAGDSVVIGVSLTFTHGFKAGFIVSLLRSAERNTKG